MSEIKNGGLDQYGKVYSPNGVGGERVNNRPLQYTWKRKTIGLTSKHRPTNSILELDDSIDCL